MIRISIGEEGINMVCGEYKRCDCGEIYETFWGARTMCYDCEKREERREKLIKILRFFRL